MREIRLCTGNGCCPTVRVTDNGGIVLEDEAEGMRIVLDREQRHVLYRFLESAVDFPRIPHDDG